MAKKETSTSKGKKTGGKSGTEAVEGAVTVPTESIEGAVTVPTESNQR